MSSENATDIEKIQFGKRFAEVCGTFEPARIQRALNISYQAAKNYLNGRLPDTRVLLTIAERTPYSIHWLLTGEGEKLAIGRGRDDTTILARQISELIRQEVASAVRESVLSRETDLSRPKTIVLRADELKSETPKLPVEANER